MSKQNLIIIGGGSLLAVILTAVWTISFLDAGRTTPPLLNNEPETAKSVTTTPTTTDTQTAPPQKKEYDLTRVSSNGQTMETPAGIEDTAIPEGEKSLLRGGNSTDGSVPEGFEKSTWPAELPVFDDGTINSILKSTEGPGWMILLDDTEQTDTDNFSKKLNDNGWQTGKTTDTDEQLYSITATKEDWEAIIIYNPEVRQTMISAAQGTEKQN